MRYFGHFLQTYLYFSDQLDCFFLSHIPVLTLPVANFRKRAWRTELMQWRKHVRIKYGGRVGVGQGQREQVQLQARVVQLQREGGARLSYVCHQPQLSSTARRSCSPAAMLCCGRRKVSAFAVHEQHNACDCYVSRNGTRRIRHGTLRAKFLLFFLKSKIRIPFICPMNKSRQTIYNFLI